MKTIYRKLEPRIVHFRDFKYFYNYTFREWLQKAISQNIGVGWDEIFESFASSCMKKEDVCERQSFVFDEQILI